MSTQPVDASVLAALGEFDTPTICNALELLDPAYRTSGFTTRELRCTIPGKQIIGYARTATIRSRYPSPLGADEMRAQRLDYYRYVHDGPRPSIAVIQDLDGEQAGFGAFWGEVQTNAHLALGCIGGVTDGSMRDLDAVAEGFQLLAAKVIPSHAYVHLVDFGGRVNVCGMLVDSGDLVHADQHGAVTVPAALAPQVAETVAKIAAREAQVIDVCRGRSVDYETFAAAYTRMTGG